MGRVEFHGCTTILEKENILLILLKKVKMFITILGMYGGLYLD
jgi:hypothetical protein